MESRMMVLASVLTAACLAGGCTEKAEGPADPVVRDSSGITVVEHPAPPPATVPGRSVAAEPTLQIGVLEGAPEYQLVRVVGATRLSDGRVVVADGGTQELRFYGPDGGFLVRAGGEGEGPGEFRGLSYLERLAGDSLLAYDWRLRRLSYFGPRGDFLRAAPLESPGASLPQLAGRFRDGSLLVRSGTSFSFRDPPEEGMVRPPVQYFRFRPDGSLSDSLLSLPGQEMWLDLEGGGAMITTLPLGRTALQAVAGDRFWVGTTDRYEVRAYAPEGGPLRILRVRLPPAPIAREAVERAIEDRLSAIGDEEARRERRAAYDRMDFPPTMPAYAALRVGTAGRLWVRRRAPPGEEEGPALWDVFEPDGRWVETLTVPGALRLLEIGPDYLLGSRRDELDVESVELRRLIRR